VLAPWNYPFHNMYNHIVSGLFTGNAVVTKVSEFTAFSSVYFERIIQKILVTAGHSPDLVQVVNGFADAGAALVGSGVDKIVFTGSPQVGKLIMRGASETLTPCVLELGGKDPFIVTDDADLDQVVPFALRGTYQNAGQNCVGAERFFVYSQVYDAFLEKVLSVVKGMKQGVPLTTPDVDMGASVTAAQIDIIDDLVQDAVRNGAKVLVGGHRNKALSPGLFYSPTIVVVATPDMRIVKEEVFGPVMTIIKVTGGDAQCLDMVNASDYGLGSSVFCRDLKRATSIASRIRCGMSVVNDFAANYLVQALPFGGVKHSGFDRFAGPEGLRALCLQKSVVVDKLSFLKTNVPPVVGYPTTPKAVQFTQGLVSMLYGTSLAQKARGVAALASAAIAPGAFKQKQN